MAERTTAEVAEIFRVAGHSVAVINGSKLSGYTDDQWKTKLKRNVQHLETIKLWKKEDEKTSIWTTEDFTAIDAAIAKGKSI
tara:strand:+ start:1409 stop:1654 length:246 start_codon:yes stop_codon:yes gene_type:complete